MSRLLSLVLGRRACAMGVAVLSLLATPPAGAATWHILPDGTGDAPTIQAAVDSSAAGDSILVAAGTYVENVVTEPGRILIGSWDEAFAVSDLELHPTTVDGDSLGPCIEADFGEQQDPDGLIAGFRLTGGAGILLNDGKRWGGGIYAVGLWRVRDCRVEHNVAHHGAGLYMRADEPELMHLEAQLNTIGYFGSQGAGTGGGLHLEIGSAATIDSSVIHGNHPDYCVCVRGGGIYATGPLLDIRNSSITNNGAACSWTGVIGGGVYSECDLLRIEDCIVSFNSSGAGTEPGPGTGGGALEAGWNCPGGMGAGIYATRAEIARTAIDSNRNWDRDWSSGGGLHAGFATLTDCSISFNTASGFDGSGSAGGIRADTLSVSNSEVVGNFAHGGLQSASAGGIRAGFLRIANTVVALSEVFGNWNASGCGITAGWIDADQIVVYGNDALRNDRFRDTVGGVQADSGRVSNSIIAGNQVQVTGDPVIVGGLSGAVSSEHNLFWDNTGEDHLGLVTAIGHVYQTPLFADSENADFHLQLHSPAIDRGDPAILDPDGSRSDIGAYGGPGADMAQPDRTTGLSAMRTPAGVELEWDANGASDLAGYAIYRLPSQDDHPSLENFLTRTTDTRFLDPVGPVHPRWYYRVSAYDLDTYGGGYSDAVAPSAGSGPVRSDAPEPPELRRLGTNPSRGPVAFSLRSPNATAARIDVFDIQGRRVWASARTVPAGPSTLRWPAVDHAGRAVPSGIYFVQIGFAGESYRRKVMVVR